MSNLLDEIKLRINFLQGKSTDIKGIYIDTMGTCTNKCYMCPARAGKKKNKYMSDELFNKVIQGLKNYNYKKPINLYGQDEPFLDPKIFDRLLHAKKELPTSEMILISNFSVLNDEKIDKLLEMPLNRLTNSIFALDAETYEKVCGSKNFERAFINLIKFCKKWSKTSPFYFSLHYIKTPYNKHDMKFIKYFLTLMPVSTTVETKLINLRGILHKNGSPWKFDTCLFNGPLKVTANGELSQCMCDHDSDYTIGNINDSDLTDIINSKRARKTRLDLLFGKDKKMNEFCSVCDFAVENKFLYFLIPNYRLRHFIANRLGLEKGMTYYMDTDVILPNSKEEIQAKLEIFNTIFKDGDEANWLNSLATLRNDFSQKR
ncbi:MAG: radical SAM protein [bacterium]